MKSDSLKYINETDRAYGLAGMAISLMAWDVEDWLESINLDAPADEGIRLSDEYYLHLAPGVGAKAVWEQSLKRFQITVAMTIANVTCRQFSQLGLRVLPKEIDTTLCQILSDEGESLCALETDEVKIIYSKSVNFCTRLFSHPGVKQLTVELAKTLIEKRNLQAIDVLSILAPLNRM